MTLTTTAAATVVTAALPAAAGASEHAPRGRTRISSTGPERSGESVIRTSSTTVPLTLRSCLNMPFIRRLPPGSTFFLVDEHPPKTRPPTTQRRTATHENSNRPKNRRILLLRYITHAYSRGMLTGIYEGMLTTLEKGRCYANHVCMHRQSMPFRDGRILHPSQACRPRNWLAERQYHRAQRGYSALSPHPADPMVIDLLKNDGIDANSHSSTPLTTDISRQAT